MSAPVSQENGHAKENGNGCENGIENFKGNKNIDEFVLPEEEVKSYNFADVEKSNSVDFHKLLQSYRK